MKTILALALLFTLYLPRIGAPGPVFSPFAVQVTVLRVVSYGLAPIPEPHAEVRVYTTAVGGALSASTSSAGGSLGLLAGSARN